MEETKLCEHCNECTWYWSSFKAHLQLHMCITVAMYKSIALHPKANCVSRNSNEMRNCKCLYQKWKEFKCYSVWTVKATNALLAHTWYLRVEITSSISAGGICATILSHYYLQSKQWYIDNNHNIFIIRSVLLFTFVHLNKLPFYTWMTSIIVPYCV